MADKTAPRSDAAVRDRIEDMIQIIVFRVGAEDYGIEIHRVTEIIHLPRVTRVPRVNDFIKGVINLRGNVIPAVDLTVRFGMEQSEYGKTARIIVVETRFDPVGLMVHEVDEVIAIPVSQVESGGSSASISDEYIAGVGKVDRRLITLLNVEAIFADREEVEDEVDKVVDKLKTRKRDKERSL